MYLFYFIFLPPIESSLGLEINCCLENRQSFHEWKNKFHLKAEPNHLAKYLNICATMSTVKKRMHHARSPSDRLEARPHFHFPVQTDFKLWRALRNERGCSGVPAGPGSGQVSLPRGQLAKLPLSSAICIFLSSQKCPQMVTRCTSLNETYSWNTTVMRESHAKQGKSVPKNQVWGAFPFETSWGTATELLWGPCPPAIHPSTWLLLSLRKMQKDSSYSAEHTRYHGRNIWEVHEIFFFSI